MKFWYKIKNYFNDLYCPNCGNKHEYIYYLELDDINEIGCRYCGNSRQRKVKLKTNSMSEKTTIIILILAFLIGGLYLLLSTIQTKRKINNRLKTEIDKLVYNE